MPALTTFLAIALFSMLAAFSGCATAKVSDRRNLGTGESAAPTVIHVADFDLDAADIHSEHGLLPLPLERPHPVRDLLMPRVGTQQDPKALARGLVDLMADSLVKELKDAGLEARRISPAQSLPVEGWLVRGVFTEVNKGNRLHRALIGFGMGKTDLQVIVDMDDLASGAPTPFYEVATTADSGKAPGAGPLIAVNPAGAAVRYVIAAGDLDRNVKDTASKIALEVVERSKRRSANSLPRSPAPPHHLAASCL